MIWVKQFSLIYIPHCKQTKKGQPKSEFHELYIQSKNMCYLEINVKLIFIFPNGIKLLLEQKDLKFMGQNSGILCYIT